MFSFPRYSYSYSMISPEMLRYIKESTNKSIEKYKNKNNYNSKLVITKKDKPPNDFFILLPFVSIVSFLAGYHFSNLKRINN